MTNSHRLSFLDGLRGIAALCVILYHHYLFLNQATSMAFSPFLEEVLLKGHLGVQIFFVLSGFVIAYSIRNASLSWEYIGRFFIRRSIRLDPPYWVALTCMIGATLFFSLVIAKEEKDLFSIGQVFTNLVYLHEFLGFTSINPVAWTLCIELQLYLFFVFVLQGISWLFRAKNREDQQTLFKSQMFAAFFALLLIGSLSYHHSILGQQMESWSPKGVFFPYWYSFFIGVACCWRLLGWLSKQWLGIYVCCIVLCLVDTFNEQVAACLVVVSVIYAVGASGYLEKWTMSSVLQYLGKISFSLYLIHWLAGSNCILFLSKRVGEMTMMKFTMIYLFSIGISILTAHLFYRWIELPCLKWSKELGRLANLKKDFA